MTNTSTTIAPVTTRRRQPAKPWMRRLIGVGCAVLIALSAMTTVKGDDDSILYADEVIQPDSGVSSPNGQVVLWYQASGYLSLWVNGSMVWGTEHAPGSNGGIAIMQGDGNFVTYDSNMVPYWDSVTWENSGAYLAVQDDGRAVIYSAGGAELWAAPGLPDWGVHCAVPVVYELQIDDAHEGPGGGDKAYMYFDDAGDPKTGDLPPMVGDETIETNVWASNVQGPWEWPEQRVQWEFARYGGNNPNNPFHQGQYSWTSPRIYPIMYRTCVYGRSNLQNQRSLRVKEHDHGFDDHVGYIKIEPRDCNAHVFDRGLKEGWTFHQLQTERGDSIVYTKYRLWCYSPTFGGDLVR